MAQLLAMPSELRPWRFELNTGVANAFYYLEFVYSKRSVLKKIKQIKKRKKKHTTKDDAKLTDSVFF